MFNKTKNKTNIKEVDWQYFPNTYQLSLYLSHSDLLQLGLTCKYFRFKLKPKILSKLELLKGNEFIPDRPNKLGKKKQLVILADVLEEEYLDRYNTINHCVFWKSINSRFARDFFNLFTNITRLELHSGYKENYDSNFDYRYIAGNTALIEALYPLKNLVSLTMSSKLINSDNDFSKKYLKLPSCLKTLHMIEFGFVYEDDFYPIDNINEEYSNLKKVSIISENMLNNMMVRMKSLTDVTIFGNRNFTKRNLVQFLLLNPQLEKLTVPEYFLGTELKNIVFQMDKLKYLSINESYYFFFNRLNNIPFNTSIEYLNLSCNLDEDKLLIILNNLKSLKVLELSNISLCYFTDINSSTCTNRIPLLHLNNLKYLVRYINHFTNPEIFDKVRYSNMFTLDDYLDKYGCQNMFDWEVCHSDPANPTDFTVTKITRWYSNYNVFNDLVNF